MDYRCLVGVAEEGWSLLRALGLSFGLLAGVEFLVVVFCIRYECKVIMWSSGLVVIAWILVA